MSKLTDLELRLIYSKAFDKQFAKGIVPAGVAALRAIESAATEPLLQRIAELEKENEVLNRLMRSGEQRGVAKGLEESKAQIKELERQLHEQAVSLEEARNQALEEAAEKMSRQHAWLTNIAAANLVLALKGEKK